jgi:hypothetical protein
MSVEECLFESKVDLTRRFIPVAIFWLFGGLFQGVFKHNYLLMTFLLLLTAGSVYIITTKSAIYELLAYNSYFTFKEGTIIKKFDYLDIISVNTIKVSSGFKLRFDLMNDDHILIPMDKIRNTELFELLIAKKIGQGKIGVELVPKYKPDLAEGRIK